MDDTVGDVPSEGGDSSRRFGIYRAFTPEPSVFSVGRLSLLFVACVAAVVAFAVFFPMLQFASRSSKTVLPFPEIANKSTEKDVYNTNCSSNVLSFGHDCTVTSKTSTTKEPTTNQDDYSTYTETTPFETSTFSTTFDDSEVVAETRHVTILRSGRSGWPAASTPYPYYLPKPTQVITDRVETDAEEANVYAIPPETSQDNLTSYIKNKPRVNFTPPPYAFTPFPNFTDSYAQLLPYKVPTNYTNLDDILRYMKSDGGDPDAVVSTEKPRGNRRLATMKVSGTYRMPLDRRRPGDDPAASEKIEEARPFFNGHAYVSDPFVKFRPSNPIDVNRLVPLRPDIGSWFRRPLLRPSTPPVEMSSERPQDRDLHAAGGSYTEAVFHGAGSAPQPSDLLTPPAPPQPPPQDSKPLSVTLDIYPVTMEMPVSDPPKGTSVPPWRDPGRFRHPQRPRWRPQGGRRPTAMTQPPPPPPPPNPADNHMVVHLNLFPNRRKLYPFPRRGGGEKVLPGTPKATLLGGGHFGARSITDSFEVDRDSSQMRGTTAPVSTTRRTSYTVENQPQYSALTGSPQDGGEREEITTEAVGVNIQTKKVTTSGENNVEENAVIKDDYMANSTSYESGLLIEENGNTFLETEGGTAESKSNTNSNKSTHSFDETLSNNSSLGDQHKFNNSGKSVNTLINVKTSDIFLDDVTVMEDDDVFVSTEPINDII